MAAPVTFIGKRNLEFAPGFDKKLGLSCGEI